MISKIRSTKIGARPERRLVEQQQLRPRHQRAADRAHLLLAAGHRAGLLARALLQPREELEDAVEVLADLRRGRCAGRRPSRGSRARSCAGRAAGPRATGRSRARRSRAPAACVMSSPSKRIVPRARLDEPGDRAQRRRLAGAVRADQRHDLALVDLERDALQRLDRAVVGVERPRARAAASLARGCGVTARSCRGRLAEVGLDHARVLLDLVRRALGDLLAVVEHGDAVGDAHDDASCRARSAGWSARARRAACCDERRERRPSPAGSCRRSARRAAAASARSPARARSRAGAGRRRAGCCA